MSKDSKVRVFQLSDQDAVVELWRRCGLVKSWNDPLLDIERKLAVDQSLFLVAEAENAVVGAVMGGYDGHRGWMNYLAVLPEWQGRGIGRQLVYSLETKLKARGCPKLNLQVRTSNQTAVQFYAQLGYQLDEVISLGKRLISDDNN